TRTLFAGNLSKTRLDRRTSRRIIVVTTDCHGLCRPILDEISSAALFITLNGRYDGSLRAQRSVEGLRSKTLELLDMGTGATSLIFMTNIQDGPSWIRRFITFSVTPHLVRLPHLPSAAALRCHLRTVTSMTDRHKLR
ncbi:hypothetical protein EJD97_008305, partial [Solanum chilense]